MVTMSSSTRQPRVLGTILRTAVGLAAIVFLVWYLFGKREVLAQALRIEWPVLLAISVGVWLVWLVRGIQARVLLGALGKRVGLGELILLTMAGMCLNYLPVRTGEAMGAVFLRRRCDLRYSRFASLVVATIGLGLLTAGVFGLIGLAASSQMGWSPRGGLVAAFGLGAAAPICLCFIPVPSKRLVRGRAGRVLRRFAVGLRRIARHRPALRWSLLTQAGQYLLRCARLYLAFHVCGVRIDPASVLLVQSLVAFGTLVLVTPGGLAVREGAIATGAEWLGLGFDAGLTAAAIDRAALVLWTTVFGLPSVFWLTQQLARTDTTTGRRDTVPVTI